MKRKSARSFVTYYAKVTLMQQLSSTVRCYGSIKIRMSAVEHLQICVRM
jgi:hypothetical protein